MGQREPSWVPAVQRRAEQRAAMIEKAREYADSLAKSIDLDSVVVFGSAARGDFNVWSDIDVLVIAGDLPSKILDRQAAVEGPPGISVVAWTPSDFEKQLRKGNAIAKEAATAKAVVVFGEEAFRSLAAIAKRPA